jgi:hypothetical protein
VIDADFDRSPTIRRFRRAAHLQRWSRVTPQRFASPVQDLRTSAQEKHVPTSVRAGPIAGGYPADNPSDPRALEAEAVAAPGDHRSTRENHLARRNLFVDVPVLRAALSRSTVASRRSPAFATRVDRREFRKH